MSYYRYDRLAVGYMIPGKWYKNSESAASSMFPRDLYVFVLAPQKNGGVAAVMWTMELDRPRATPKPKKTPIQRAWFDQWKEIPEHEVPEKVRRTKPKWPPDASESHGVTLDPEPLKNASYDRR